MEEHALGLDKNCYTFERRPIQLKFIEEFNNVNDAISRETQMKGWLRKKKRALIENKFDELIKLAKNYDSRRLPFDQLRVN